MSTDPRLRLRWGVELRNGRIVSAHGEREWAEKELASWILYGPMVVDLDECIERPWWTKPNPKCPGFKLAPGEEGNEQTYPCILCGGMKEFHE